MATGYIMCRHVFKYARIFKLWRQVVGYSLVLAVIAWIVLPAGSVGWRDWAGAAMPITFNRYWFFTEYVALFFSIPFLNKMLSVLTHRERNVLMASGFGILSALPFFAGSDLFIIQWGYSYVWFLYLYLLGACLALGDVKKGMATGWLLTALIVGVLGSAGGAIMGPILTARFGGGARVAELAYSYASPTLLLEAVALLLLFAKIDLRSERIQKVIGLVAPSIFVVYIVHSNPVFRRLTEWKTCFHGLIDFGEWGVIGGTIVLSILIFTGIVFVDILRRWVLSRLWKW